MITERVQLVEAWPPLVRQLARDFNPADIRQVGIAVLGFPPDVFGLTYEEMKRLTRALRNNNQSQET